MKKLPKTATALLLICMAISCKKSDEIPEQTELQKLNEAAPITTSGKNTFGMLVDGKMWLPKGQLFGNPPVTIEYLNKIFYLRCVKEKEFFSIDITDRVIDTGIYKVYSNAKDRFRYGLYDDYDTTVVANADSLHIGIIKFARFDTVRGIMSATFYGTLKYPNGKELKITEGRFDYRF